MPAQRHRLPLWGPLVAGGLVIAAVLWIVVAVPALVKYPTDLDISPRYEGTFTLFVDPATAAPLDDPVEVPLVVERHLEVIDNGATRVVVRETIAQQAGDLIDTTQTNVYVMDRSTLENLDDDRAFAFQPENVVDRSGTYRLNLPFDAGAEPAYSIYKNEIDDVYQLRATQVATVEEGLSLNGFSASVVEAPLSEAYLAELNRIVPLPESMTLEQLDPQLRAAGIDVAGVLSALAPVITPDDLAILASATGEPVPLRYVLSFEGQAAVEPTTGAEVHVGASESVGARPELATLPVLTEVLSRYPEVPEAAAAIDGLEQLAAAPAITLFEYRYDQTPASVADVADEVRSMRTEVRLAEVWLPAGLVLLAAGVLAATLVVYLLRRRTTAPPQQPAAETIDLRTTETGDNDSLVLTNGRRR